MVLAHSACVCVRLLAYEWVWDCEHRERRGAAALTSLDWVCAGVIKRLPIKSDDYCGRKYWWSPEIRARATNQKVLSNLCLLSTLLNNSLRLSQSYRKWDVNFSRDYGGEKNNSQPSFLPPLPSPFPTKLFPRLSLWRKTLCIECKDLWLIDKVCWFKMKKTRSYGPKLLDVKHKPLEIVHKLPKST